MERKQTEQIVKDLRKKMVFLVGPRQVGKTWLARRIAERFPKSVYLNYDRIEDRAVIKKGAWLKDAQLLLLDELQKMPGWKNYLKGLFDTRPEGLKILVTGSARLDVFRQTGDSLAGRYFIHRLMPLSPAEIGDVPGTGYDIDRFCTRGGFPEPFLAESDTEADRWRMLYVEDLIRNDVHDLKAIHDLNSMKLVLEFLRRRVGAPVSYASIAQDAELSPNTVKSFIQIFEALYILFRVTPFTRSVARSLLKNPKIYFYDTGMVIGDPGVVFENFTAVSLLKETLARTDQLGRDFRLQYIRTKEGREVDFCLTKDGKAERLVEAKLSDPEPSAPLLLYTRNLNVPGVQVVKDLRLEYADGKVEVRSADSFFKTLFL